MGYPTNRERTWHVKHRSSSDQYEWGVHNIWDVVSYVYADEFELFLFLNLFLLQPCQEKRPLVVAQHFVFCCSLIRLQYVNRSNKDISHYCVFTSWMPFVHCWLAIEKFGDWSFFFLHYTAPSVTDCSFDRVYTDIKKRLFYLQWHDWCNSNGNSSEGSVSSLHVLSKNERKRNPTASGADKEPLKKKQRSA